MEQNAELLRLIQANKARLQKLQETIKDLQQRAAMAGEKAHLWDEVPRPEQMGK